MDEYTKAMLDQIASLKKEVIFLRGEVKEKNTFIEQINNNNNNNNNSSLLFSVYCSISYFVTPSSPFFIPHKIFIPGGQ